MPALTGQDTELTPASGEVGLRNATDTFERHLFKYTDAR